MLHVAMPEGIAHNLLPSLPAFNERTDKLGTKNKQISSAHERKQNLKDHLQDELSA